MNEMADILEQFKKVLDMCMERINYMDKMFEDYRTQNDERLHTLESTLYDEIINPTKEYIDETNRNARFEDFDAKYGDKLRPFNEPLSALEGEDFDIVRSAFDKYDSYDGDKADMDSYVEVLIEEVGNQLDAIKRGLGLPADAEIEVKQTEDGETVVEVEDEGSEDEEIIASTEDEEAEDDPEEVAAFEEELRNL